ncbi:MAG: hypothetical protein M1550_05810 [Deltaproteobacteria bacterium]|nr:hypothetical protein [Deltaproteobacteria bacterium]
MNLETTSRLLMSIVAAAALFAGCGGGDTPQGGASAPPESASVLAWDPPATYNDNTSMDPYADLDYYELYLRQDGNFTDNDLPVVQVAAVSDVPSADNQSVVRSLVTEFDLDLIPQIPQGARLYVSMKAVGIDGQKSAFMTPVAWDRM